MKNRSKVIHNEGYHWDGVEKKLYKTDTTNFRGVTRYSLLGEADDEWELNMQTRYFEVEAGGYTSLEFHRHPHSVLIIRGSGSVVLGNEVHTLGLHDVVFISPETIHQFHADRGEALGFICIVDRYRDKPMVPTSEMVTRVMEGAVEAGKKIRL
jgi:quercetin dioxygenase-like cupin family protein